MGKEEQNLRIDYIEFPARDLAVTKRFYRAVFGWDFKDWGADYSSFRDGRLTGGFRTDAAPVSGGPLVVIYATDLAATERKVKEHGGTIVQQTFEFPGGRRFHFADPSGNHLAVWSDRAEQGSRP